MRRTLDLLALAAMAASLSSCLLGRGSVNEPLDPAVLGGLEPGRSTAGDVTALLGGPSQVVELGTRTAYLYEYRVNKVTGLVTLVLNVATLDQRSDRIWVFFDEDLVLTHYGATLTGHRAQYALPWSDLHDAPDDRAMDARRAGLPPGGTTGG